MIYFKLLSRNLLLFLILTIFLCLFLNVKPVSAAEVGCGDGSCDADWGETCSTCEPDCGACSCTPTSSSCGNWDACSATCGGGAQYRWCTDDCGNGWSEGQTCNPEPCGCTPASTTCGDWSTCSASCGGGTQWRDCTDGCTNWTENNNCNTQSCGCTPTGSSCGNCSASCGGGIRSCSDDCGGSWDESCNTQACNNCLPICSNDGSNCGANNQCGGICQICTGSCTAPISNCTGCSGSPGTQTCTGSINGVVGNPCTITQSCNTNLGAVSCDCGPASGYTLVNCDTGAFCTGDLGGGCHYCVAPQSGTQSHAACSNNSCVQIPGPGPNTCAWDADCSTPTANTCYQCNGASCQAYTTTGACSTNCSNCPGGIITGNISFNPDPCNIASGQTNCADTVTYTYNDSPAGILLCSGNNPASSGVSGTQHVAILPAGNHPFSLRYNAWNGTGWHCDNTTLLDNKSLTVNPPPSCTIQGFKVLMPGNQNAAPASTQTITLDGAANTATQPYFFYNVSSGIAHTITASTIPGYNIGYTVCTNRIDCHTAVPTPGNSISVSCSPTGGYVDLWWHYTPNSTPTPTFTPTPTPIPPACTLVNLLNARGQYGLISGITPSINQINYAYSDILAGTVAGATCNAAVTGCTNIIDRNCYVSPDVSTTNYRARVDFVPTSTTPCTVTFTLHPPSAPGGDVCFGTSSNLSYSWYTGTWGACVSCNQTRTVECRRSDGITVDDAYCSGTKPNNQQTSPPATDCAVNGTYGAWVCNTACGGGTQTRTCFGAACGGTCLGPSAEPCPNPPTCPAYMKTVGGDVHANQ